MTQWSCLDTKVCRMWGSPVGSQAFGPILREHTVFRTAWFSRSSGTSSIVIAGKHYSLKHHHLNSSFSLGNPTSRASHCPSSYLASFTALTVHETHVDMPEAQWKIGIMSFFLQEILQSLFKLMIPMGRTVPVKFYQQESSILHPSKIPWYIHSYHFYEAWKEFQ